MMADFEDVEAWNTSVRLAAAVGRLKIASNLKASADAQSNAFEQAGVAAGLIAEGAGREGPQQAGLYRDARGALAQCSSWLHVLANVTNQPAEAFGQELELAELASKQLGGILRTLDRPLRPGGGPPPGRGGPQPGGMQRQNPPMRQGGGQRGGGGGPR